MPHFFSRLALCATPFFFTISALSQTTAQSSLDRSWTILKAGLEDKNVETRTTSVRLLGMLTGNPQAGPLAVKALSDDRPDVREAATDALGALKDKSAATELHKIVQDDKDAAVILGAARALLAIGDPMGYSVFYAVLTGEKKSGEGLMEEQKKMLHDPKKLAQFGFEQGVGFVPFGGIGLTVVKTLTKDDTSPVRAAAAKILANDPDVKSLAALEESTGDQSWIVQVAALAALAQRGDVTALSTIEIRLDEPKDAVHCTAAAAYIHLTDVKNSPKSATISKHRASKARAK